MLLRCLQWGFAAVVGCFGVGFGLQQHLNHTFTAVVRGVVKCGIAVIVLGLDLRFSLQQLGYHSLAAVAGGQVKCGRSKVSLGFEVGLGFRIQKRLHP